MYVKFDFQVCRDYLAVTLHRLDLVEYSRIRCYLGRIYWRWSRVASSSGHPGASRWFLVAALVNFLQLPVIGQWAATEGFRVIPQEDRQAFQTAATGGAALD